MPIENLQQAREFIKEMEEGEYTGGESIIKAELSKIKDLVKEGKFTWTRLGMSKDELERYFDQAANTLAKRN